MGVGELLDRIRALYVDRFEEIIEEEKLNAKTIIEPAMLNASGEVVSSGKLIEAPNRLDLVLIQASEQTKISVDSARQLGFSTISFSWSPNFIVKLGPFTWDNLIAICIAPENVVPKWSFVQSWFSSAFKEKNSNQNTLGCVHFISEPQRLEDGWKIALDLGTAPVADFEGLLDAIHAAGFTQVAIGNVEV